MSLTRKKRRSSFPREKSPRSPEKVDEESRFKLLKPRKVRERIRREDSRERIKKEAKERDEDGFVKYSSRKSRSKTLH